MTNLMDMQVKVTLNEGIVLFGTVNDVTPNGRYIHIENEADFFVIDTAKALVEVVEEKEEELPKAETKRVIEIPALVKTIEKAIKYADEYTLKVNVYEYEEDEHGFDVEISINIDGEQDWIHTDTFGDYKPAMRRAKHMVKALVAAGLELSTLEIEHYWA